MPVSDVLNAIAIDHAQIMRAAGMTPDPWQAQILRRRGPRDILNCCRQVGKTDTIAAAAVVEVLYYAPAFVAVLGPAEKQALEFVRSVKRILNALGIDVDPEVESKKALELPNGSRLLANAANEKTVRGLAGVTYLIFDEAARVSDDLYHAARPMVSISRGRIALLSTPFGKRGFFHKEWSEGSGWARYSVTGYECKRHSAEFLAEEKSKMPDNWFRQEYMCEFADTDDAMFRFDDVKAAMSDDVVPLFADLLTAQDANVRPLFQ